MKKNQNMTAGQKLEKLAGTKWNPYFLAYAIETGAKNPPEAFKCDGGN